MSFPLPQIVPEDERPDRCPGCKSRSISTTARKPDESSYWRCETCGEIWNAGRRKAARREPQPWR